MLVEDGFVEVLLFRVETDALSYGAVEAEFSVPPLPLGVLARAGVLALPRSYRLASADTLPYENRLSSSSSNERFGRGKGLRSVEALSRGPASNEGPFGPGRSKTRNDDCPGGFWTSSRALPDDFRR